MTSEELQKALDTKYITHTDDWETIFGDWKIPEPKENNLYNAEWRQGWINLLEGKDTSGEKPGFASKLNESMDTAASSVDEAAGKFQEWINKDVGLSLEEENGWLRNVSDSLKIAKAYTEKTIDYAGWVFNGGKNITDMADALFNKIGNWAGNSIFQSWLGIPYDGGKLDYNFGTASNDDDDESEEIKSNLTQPENLGFSGGEMKEPDPYKSDLNYNLEKLFKQGPDLFSNSFELFIVCSSKDDEKILNFVNIGATEKEKTLRRFLGSTDEISVRSSSIEIPLRNQNSYSEKFFNSEVEIANHSVSFENRADLKLDLDSNLNILEVIKRLSNLPNFKKEISDESTEKDDKFVIKDIENKTKKIYNVNYSNNKESTLDIVVNSKCFSNWLNISVNKNLQKKSNNILFIFKNVKFYGIDNISFNKEAGGLQNKSFPFIFESLYEVYKMNSDLKADNKYEWINGTAILNSAKYGTDIISIKKI